MFRGSLRSFSLLTAVGMTSVLCPMSTFAMGAASLPPPKTVASVDVPRYMGKWFEIARFEQRFQKGCVGVTAEYALLENGKVSVLNTCFDTTLDGEMRQAKGRAYVKNTSTNAELRVSFFWPFYGDYWIFELGSDYEYAVVGSPDRGSLWFLSRSPIMDDELFGRLIAKMKSQDFDMSLLQKTPQR